MIYKGYNFSVDRDGLHIEENRNGNTKLIILPIPIMEKLGLKTFDDAIKYFKETPEAEFV